MSFFKITTNVTKKISCVIVLLMPIALVECVNAPQNPIETDGLEITEDLIQAIHRYDYIEDFHNGFALVKKYPDDWSDEGGIIQYGFIDTKGEEVVSCIYEHYCEEFEWRSNYYIGTQFEEGLARVTRGGKYGFVNIKGKEVASCRYDEANDFSEGMALVKYNGKYGYINTNGDEVVPCQYDNASNFSEGLAAIRQSDRKWGYINKTGNIVIPCKYDYASDFSSGIASVYLGHFISSTLKGFIDKRGRSTFTQADWDEYEKTKDEEGVGIASWDQDLMYEETY